MPIALSVPLPMQPYSLLRTCSPARELAAAGVDGLTHSWSPNQWHSKKTLPAESTFANLR